MFSCPIALVDDLPTRASPLWMQLELFSVQTLLLCAGAQRGAGAALLLCPALSTAPGKKPLEQAKQQPWDSNYSQPQNPTTPGSLRMNLEKLSDAFSSFSFVLLGEVGGVLGLGCCWQCSPHLTGAECLGEMLLQLGQGQQDTGNPLVPQRGALSLPVPLYRDGRRLWCGAQTSCTGYRCALVEAGCPPQLEAQPCALASTSIRDIQPSCSISSHI